MSNVDYVDFEHRGKQPLSCCFRGHPPVAMPLFGDILHMFSCPLLKFICVLTGKSMTAMAFGYPSFEHPPTALCHPYLLDFMMSKMGFSSAWTQTAQQIRMVLLLPHFCETALDRKENHICYIYLYLVLCWELVNPDRRKHHKVLTTSKRAGSEGHCLSLPRQNPAFHKLSCQAVILRLIFHTHTSIIF